MRLASRAAARRLAVLFAILGLLTVWAWADMMRMPGDSFAEELPPLTAAQKESAQRLEAHVRRLAASSRTLTEPAVMRATVQNLEAELSGLGLTVGRHDYETDGHTVSNVVALLPGEQPSVVIVGAHYDTAEGVPGANDNASGVAAMLELARALAGKRFHHTLRFVGFANEEPPYFQGEGMGSLAYAEHCRERSDDVVAMLSLETMGYFTSEPNSQHYPPPFAWFYPSTGDFIAFVGDRSAGPLVRRAIESFRAASVFPSEGAAPPGFIQGVGWSDQWSFWQHGYPNAIMVTDTAPFRYPHYHRRGDTPDKLDYESMARVVTGLEKVVVDLASAPDPT